MAQRRDSLGNVLGRKMSGSARKLSRVSTGEMEDAKKALKKLFVAFSAGESGSGLTSAQFVQLVEECSLVDKRCKTSDVQLIFSSTQVGKKQSINFDRFQEAFRKLAVKKEMTYHELVEQAVRNFSGSTIAVETTEAASPPTAPADIAGSIPPTLKEVKIGGDLIYRYVIGKTPGIAKQNTYYNLTPNISAWMHSPVIAAGAKMWAVPWKGGGGPVYVSPISKTGKVEVSTDMPLLHGHKAPVIDIAFDPFDDFTLATAGDDAKINVWRLPEAGLETSQQSGDALLTLTDHTHSVRTLKFHPCAQGLLLSTSSDMSLRVWDLQGGGASIITMDARHHPELIFNTSFSPDGTRVATACKDRQARIVDPRTNNVVASAVAHQGTKGMRVQWLSGENIATVGFGAMAQREFKIWDCRMLSRGPMQTTKIDNSGGLLFPLYDQGTGMLYLAGKGDGNIRYYEVKEARTGGGGGEVKALYDGQFSVGGPEPTCGVALLPKRLVNVHDVELLRVLRLTNTAVEPVSFSLPRTDKLKAYFQDEVFPPAPSGAPSHSAADWLSGGVAMPVLQSLRPEGMPLMSERPPEAPAVSPAQNFRMKISMAEEEEAEKNATFSRMQALAVQRSQYHPNQSMGAKKGVDMERVDDSDDSDGGWDD